MQEQIKKLEKNHAKHIAAYGEGNERRLTGKHETSSMCAATRSQLMLRACDHARLRQSPENVHARKTSSTPSSGGKASPARLADCGTGQHCTPADDFPREPVG